MCYWIYLTFCSVSREGIKYNFRIVVRNVQSICLLGLNYRTILEVFKSGEHSNNVSHFIAIVNLAYAKGIPQPKEERTLKKLAFILDISYNEYKTILKKHYRFPFIGVYGHKERLSRFRDLLTVMNADDEIDKAEYTLIYKYAIALGFSDQEVKNELSKHLRVFEHPKEFKNLGLVPFKFVKSMFKQKFVRKTERSEL